MKALQISVKIRSNRQLAGPYYRLAFKSPAVARYARPGQFVMVRVSVGPEPLLRRPLSIHRVHQGVVELLYEVVGQGTRLLARQKPGQVLDVLGPLGNGFVLSCAAKAPVLVAGGIGGAPLVFLAQKLRTHKGLALLGARTAGAVLCEKEFKELGFGVTIATDDGSRGFDGRVTALLKQKLAALDYRPSAVFACGPLPMAREVARICAVNRIPAQVSLEAHMACGIGACLGCAVKTKSGYQRVCKDGPVFNIDELV